MGRPLNKKWFGADSDSNIKVQFHNGTESVRGYIVKQKSSKRFKCIDTDGNTATCLLVDKAATALAAGEMTISAKFDNTTVDQVTKIAGRVATVGGLKKHWNFSTSTSDTYVQFEEAGTDAYMTGATDLEGDDPVIPAGMDRNQPLPGTGTLALPSTYVTAFSASGMTYRNISASALDSVTNSTAGLYRRKYVGNFSASYIKDVSWVFDVNYMKDRSHGPISTLDHEVDTSVAFNRSDLGDENNYAFEWKGYIQAPATGNFNFFAAVDDDCIVWIGAPATATTLGSTTSDYLFAQTGGTRNGSTQGIAMTANKWYPIRIWFQEWAGSEQFQLGASCSANSTRYGSGGTNFNFAHNSATKGY
jgi:hypothetical protein